MWYAYIICVLFGTHIRRVLKCCTPTSGAYKEVGAIAPLIPLPSSLSYSSTHAFLIYSNAGLRGSVSMIFSNIARRGNRRAWISPPSSKGNRIRLNIIMCLYTYVCVCIQRSTCLCVAVFWVSRHQVLCIAPKALYVCVQK